MKKIPRTEKKPSPRKKNVATRKNLVAELKSVLRMKRSVPFKRFQKVVGKLQQAAIRIPQGKRLFVLVNKAMSLEPKLVF